MVLVSKFIILICAIILFFDGIKTMMGYPNIVNPAWPFPCPLNMAILAIGIILFIVGGGIHRHSE